MSVTRLYFAQHGLAVSESENPDRPLSETGNMQTKAIAEHIYSSGNSISHIFHSGKLRALQTAEIFATSLKIPATSAIEHLSPNDDVSLLAQKLTINNALYIGHLPHLENLITYLVTGEQQPGIIKLQNSAIVCLEKTNGLYRVLWYLTPDLAGF